MNSSTTGSTNGADEPLRSRDLAGATHIGWTRQLNEDSYLCANFPHLDAILLGVADGMGGHEGGEIASFLVIRSLIASWNNRRDIAFQKREEVNLFLENALEKANQHIFKVNQKLRIRWVMGTTVTFGVCWNHHLNLVHVGDSRAYCWRDGTLQQLTRDHNWMEEMILSGALSRRQAKAHPMAGMLTNCLGGREELEMDFKSIEIRSGDRFLFCSDGLSSMVAERKMEKIIGEAPGPDDAVSSLIELSLSGGGLDNITAVCLFF